MSKHDKGDVSDAEDLDFNPESDEAIADERRAILSNYSTLVGDRDLDNPEHLEEVYEEYARSMEQDYQIAELLESKNSIESLLAGDPSNLDDLELELKEINKSLKNLGFEDKKEEKDNALEDEIDPDLLKMMREYKEKEATRKQKELSLKIDGDDSSDEEDEYQESFEKTAKKLFPAEEEKERIGLDDRHIAHILEDEGRRVMYSPDVRKLYRSLKADNLQFNDIPKIAQLPVDNLQFVLFKSLEDTCNQMHPKLFTQIGEANIRSFCNQVNEDSKLDWARKVLKQSNSTKDVLSLSNNLRQINVIAAFSQEDAARSFWDLSVEKFKACPQSLETKVSIVEFAANVKILSNINKKKKTEEIKGLVDSLTGTTREWFLEKYQEDVDSLSSEGIEEFKEKIADFKKDISKEIYGRKDLLKDMAKEISDEHFENPLTDSQIDNLVKGRKFDELGKVTCGSVKSKKTLCFGDLDQSKRKFTELLSYNLAQRLESDQIRRPVLKASYVNNQDNNSVEQFYANQHLMYRSSARQGRMKDKDVARTSVFGEEELEVQKIHKTSKVVNAANSGVHRRGTLGEEVFNLGNYDNVLKIIHGFRDGDDFLLDSDVAILIRATLSKGLDYALDKVKINGKNPRAFLNEDNQEDLVGLVELFFGTEGFRSPASIIETNMALDLVIGSESSWEDLLQGKEVKKKGVMKGNGGNLSFTMKSDLGAGGIKSGRTLSHDVNQYHERQHKYGGPLVTAGKEQKNYEDEYLSRKSNVVKEWLVKVCEKDEKDVNADVLRNLIKDRESKWYKAEELEEYTSLGYSESPNSSVSLDSIVNLSIGLTFKEKLQDRLGGGELDIEIQGDDLLLKYPLDYNLNPILDKISQGPKYLPEKDLTHQIIKINKDQMQELTFHKFVNENGDFDGFLGKDNEFIFNKIDEEGVQSLGR